MSYEDYEDEWAVIEANRQRLAAKEFGDGEAAAAIATILNGYEKLLVDTRRLIRISDQLKQRYETNRQYGFPNGRLQSAAFSSDYRTGNWSVPSGLGIRYRC